MVNELYAGIFQDAYGIETVSLRYFNVFGPRQNPNGPYAAVIPRWVLGRFFTANSIRLLTVNGAASPNEGIGCHVSDGILCCSPEIFAILFREEGRSPPPLERGMAEDEIYTLRKSADYFKHAKRTHCSAMQEGQLPGLKGGNWWRFRLWEIDSWIEAQRAEVPRDGARRWGS